MEALNPAVIPRNHVVEAALESAMEGDYGEFHALVDVVVDPYRWPKVTGYTTPPTSAERVAATFCGT